MDAFIGEIRPFAFDYQPEGWMTCDGRLLSIQQYQVLFSVIGNLYGGDLEKNNFRLPDLRNQPIIGAGTGTDLTERKIGTTVGDSKVALTEDEMPNHRHLAAGGVGAQTTRKDKPDSDIFYLSNFSYQKNGTALTSALGYVNVSPNTGLNPATIGTAGGGQQHDNIQPLLIINYCICEEGEYPVKSE